MTLKKFENFAFGHLATTLSAGATTIKLQSGQAALFPPPPAYVTVWDDTASPGNPAGTGLKEIVLYQAKDDVADELRSCLRGRQGTTAQAFDSPARSYGVARTWTRDDIEERDALLSGFEPGVVSIKSHGAVGDGVADDSTAWANAVAALKALQNSGGTLLVPNGSFRIGAQVALPDDELIYIRGLGMAASKLEQIDPGASPRDFIINEGVGTDGPVIQSLSIEGHTTNGQHAVNFDDLRRPIIEDVFFLGAGPGKYLMRLRHISRGEFLRLRLRGGGADGYIYLGDDSVVSIPLTVRNTFRDITTWNNGPGEGGVAGAALFNHLGARNTTIERVNFDGAETDSIVIQESHDVIIRDFSSAPLAGVTGKIDLHIFDSDGIRVFGGKLGNKDASIRALDVLDSENIMVLGTLVWGEVDVDLASRNVQLDSCMLRELTLKGPRAVYPYLRISNSVKVSKFSFAGTEDIHQAVDQTLESFEVVRGNPISGMNGDVRPPQGKDFYTRAGRYSYLGTKGEPPSGSDMEPGSVAPYFEFINGVWTLRLRARDPSGAVSDWEPGIVDSEQAEDTIPPSQVTGEKATAVSDTQIIISWDHASDNVGVAGYKVFRDGVQVANTSNTSYSDGSLTPSTLYAYTIQAFDFAGNHGTASASTSDTTFGTADTEPPTASTNPAATPVSATEIDVSWGAATDNEGVAKYEIRRGLTAGGAKSKIGEVGGATLTFRSSGLSASTTYYYEIVAVDAAGNVGPASTEVSATTNAASTDTTPPTVPANPSATANSGWSITVAWDASTDSQGSVSHYRVYRDGVWVKDVVAPGDGTAGRPAWDNDFGLREQTQYSYTVSAVDDAGNESAVSTAALATTLTLPSGAAPESGDGATLLVGNFSAFLVSAVNWIKALDGSYIVEKPAAATVDVDSMTPAWTDEGFGFVNGAQVNPRYDQEAQGIRESWHFNGALRFSAPGTLAPDDTLVATHGIAKEADVGGEFWVKSLGLARPMLHDARAICHVVANGALPTEECFRPGYADDGVKKIWRKADFNLHFLDNCRLAEPSIPISDPDSAKAWADIESMLRRTWSHWTGMQTAGGRIGPADQYQYMATMATRGNLERGQNIGRAALKLLLDYPLTQKQKTAEGIVQIGLDMYSIFQTDDPVNNPLKWGRCQGSLGAGFMFPIFFAGICLGDQGMLDASLYIARVCQEVNQLQVLPADKVEYGYPDPHPLNGGVYPWAEVQPGDVVWTTQSEASVWNEDTSQNWLGYIKSSPGTWHYIPLFCYIVNNFNPGMQNLRSIWNHDPLFDYLDWHSDFYAKDDFRRFHWMADIESFWDTYRPLYGPPKFIQPSLR